MKSAKYLLILLTVISFVQSGCKKGETAKTKTDYLTQKPWVLVGQQTRFSSASGSTDWVDVFKDQQACVVDDIYTYTATGQYTKDEGATKCSSADPQIITDSWIWESGTNGTLYLRLLSGGSRPVTQLDDDTLAIVFLIATPGGTIDNRLTFAHP